MGKPSPHQGAEEGRADAVVWVTNVSAPYRHPVWATLAEETQLSVGLLAENEPNRQWTADLPPGVRRAILRTRALHRGEHHVYVLLAPGLAGQPDLVILPGWESPAAWQLLLEAKLRKIHTIAFYESAVSSHRFSAGLVAAARRWFFRSVDAVVTVGAASEDAVLGFGVDPARVVTTYNAVDVEAIRKAVGVALPGNGDRSQHFVYVGQLIDRKNVATLLDAFARLPHSARLLVVGEGPEEGNLRRRAAHLGLGSRVDFVGYVPYSDVPLKLSRAATLVLPSRSEVYGLVVVEALAAGLHVVVTRNCGVYADVADLSGVFAAEPTAESLANAMLLSQAGWQGPLDQPGVLARTPRAMAEDVLWACVVARSSR